MTESIAELLDRWNSDEGHPYKGALIDWSAYEAEPDNIGCMCAQGQVLALCGGWEPQRLRDAEQDEADTETARLLNISRAHAVLLRNINDKQDGAPSIVLTDPGKVLGDQWGKLLDFWWAIDQFDAAQWQKVAASGDAAGAASGGAAWAADGVASGVAAGGAAREIQGFSIMRERGQDLFFLPMFGWSTTDEIPARPADYGNGVVPVGERVES